MEEFQATQVLDEDNQSSQSFSSSGSSQKLNEKIQIGTIEISGSKHPIYKGLTIVGRHPACDIQINDIVSIKQKNNNTK
ncbi:hypothetical protein HCN44_009066 [Aphidius gifuensis]|uniref:Uncharacterized protein n=1 Tax=Aphidius gifuensis TaxID=684658 RepID=A0A834XYP6_APHGI|nr:hypothetical protein HCN44_009066 [Aphidius gifuensis]